MKLSLTTRPSSTTLAFELRLALLTLPVACHACVTMHVECSRAVQSASRTHACQGSVKFPRHPAATASVLTALRDAVQEILAALHAGKLSS